MFNWCGIVFIDCDNDTILLKVEQLGGAACHTGYRSCFYRKLVDGKLVTRRGTGPLIPRQYTNEQQIKNWHSEGQS